AIVEALRQAPFARSLAWPPFPPATVDQLARVHDPSYLTALEENILSGADRLDADTAVSFDSWQAALAASGALIAAVADVVSGTYANAFCPVRPPGHHAERSRAMGFCLVNHVAVAAREAQEALGLARIAIVDFDVHHGNGTQQIFYNDPSVLYVSLHLSPHYPGTGAFSETGRGAGQGGDAQSSPPGRLRRPGDRPPVRAAGDPCATPVRPGADPRLGRVRRPPGRPAGGADPNRKGVW
ncbi:MAG: hypothetical protein HQK87_09215, partial [Nitrospinae bacterium]|nr:hypothetical protein [Nitrospinota bacterium]